MVPQYVIPVNGTSRPFEMHPKMVRWFGNHQAFYNTTESLRPKDYYTDTTSCAMDAFNLAVGKKLLTREALEAARIARGLPDSLQLQTGAVEFFHPVVTSFIHRFGFALINVHTKDLSMHMFTNLMKQISGVFFVEFFWHKRADPNLPAGVSLCSQRLKATVANTFTFKLAATKQFFCCL